MANVSFQYRSNQPTANIEVRFTFKQNDVFKSYYTRTNMEVSKSFWNEYKKNTNFRDVEKANLKTDVEKLLKEMSEFIITQYNKHTTDIKKDWLKDTVQDFYNPKSETIISDSLLQFFDFYLSIKQPKIKAGTFKKLKVVRNKLENFENATKRTFKIKDVNQSFLNEFITWSKEMLYDNSVINSNFKDIRGVCREAQKYNIETDKHLYTLKTELYAPPTIITYLSEDELKQIINLKNLPEYLDNVRDWLIISCYTGQRVSDFMRFTPDMIDRKNNRSLIHITQQKTGKKVAIPLLPIVENILKKRNGNFPKPISDQKYNDYIKEVCRKAKISNPIEGKITTVTDVGTRREAGIYPKWQLISSHVGRRSFATNFYGKIPTPYIKDITGHGTEAMLLKYIGKEPDNTAREAYDLMLKLK